MSSVTLRISMSDQGLLRIARQFGATARELSKAAKNGTMDATRSAQGKTRTAIRAHATLPLKSVNKRVRISQSPTEENPTGIVRMDMPDDRGRKQRPSLMSYGGKPRRPPHDGKVAQKRRLMGRAQRRKRRAPKRKDFTYQIVKGGPRRTHPKAFVARKGGQSHAQAFVRTGKSRYPLIVPRGPSIPALWQNKSTGIADEVLTHLREFLPSEIQRHAQLIYDRKFRKVSS